MGRVLLFFYINFLEINANNFMSLFVTEIYQRVLSMIERFSSRLQTENHSVFLKRRGFFCVGDSAYKRHVQVSLETAITLKKADVMCHKT